MPLPHIIRRSIEALRLRASPRRKGQNSHLLDLPIKQLLLVLQHLPPVSQVILSQTCRTLYFALQGRISRPEDISREERLDLLVALARGLPDRWVCGICSRLHVFVKDDVPGHFDHCACPYGWRRLRDSQTGPAPVRFQHHHVQLALKFSRLGCEPVYIEKVLRPEPFQGLAYFRHAGWLQPKIVNGRFLVMVSRFGQFSSENAAIPLQVCHHLELRKDVSVAPFVRAMESQHRRELAGLPPEYVSPMCYALEEATRGRQMGKEVEGSCYRCPVDWMMLKTAHWFYIYSWHDYGPEGSPLDSVWRGHLDQVHLSGEEVPAGHEPGSIRRLYGTPPLIPQENMQRLEKFLEDQGFR